MNNAYSWYEDLVKPSWAPPSYLFGPVWTFLYALIFISYGYVGYLFYAKKIPFIVLLPFILNLIFNLIFSPIQFGLRSNIWAAVDILLVLATLLWALWAIYPYVPWVTYINIPYTIWVCFATVLQLSVTYLNK